MEVIMLLTEYPYWMHGRRGIYRFNCPHYKPCEERGDPTCHTCPGPDLGCYWCLPASVFAEVLSD